MKNHVKNAILGLVVGDALGVPVEFKSRKELRTHPVTAMIGFGTHNQPVGTWSDDSSLALCLADELTLGYDLQRIGNSFVDWFYHGRWTPHGKVFDVGIATSKAIERLRKGVAPHLAGDWEVTSNGNGSLMRILPLFFYIRNFKKVDRYQIAREVSCLTHGHVRASLACFYYLEFAKAICEGEDKYAAYQVANEMLKDLTRELNINPEEVALFNRLLSGNIQELEETEIQSTGYVLHTLEASLWCILTYESYKSSVLKAVNLGDDTDTTGAVTGGLAGLIYGAEKIPENWLNQIARLSDIEALICRLTEKYKEASC